MAGIEFKMRLAAKENEQAVATIEDAISRDRARSAADAEFYRTSRLAAADQLRLTPKYLQLERYRALAQNAKVYFASLSGQNPLLPPEAVEGPSSSSSSDSADILETILESLSSQGGALKGLASEFLSTMMNASTPVLLDLFNDSTSAAGGALKEDDDGEP